MRACLTAFALFSVTILFAQTLHPQQLKDVDFISADAYLTFDVPSKQVMGKVTYTFDVLSKPDTIYIDARNMQFKEVRVNGKKKDRLGSFGKCIKAIQRL